MSNFPYNTRTHRVEGASFTAAFFSAMTKGVAELVESRETGSSISLSSLSESSSLSSQSNTIMIPDVKLGGTQYEVSYSPAGKSVFSAERIQRSVAVFDSRPIVMSSEVTSWKELLWSSVVPEGASLYAYVRTASTEELLDSAIWQGPLLNGSGEDISSQLGKIMQFRLAMYSAYEPSTGVASTPEVSLVSASCYVRGSSQMLYTTTMSLGFVPTHVMVTYNGTVPTDTLISFAVSTEDSIDQKDYKLIDPNTVAGMEEIAKNPFLKIAISAIGNTEVPFVIDEFAVAVSGDGFTKIVQ